MEDTRIKAKETFELASYELDSKINEILDDLDNSNDIKLLKSHAMLIGRHLEQYMELQMRGIHVLPVDVDFLSTVQNALVDKILLLL
jgi:hypothetical protein